MKIIEFIKNNKVSTIAASVVLVAAVAVSVTFGVLNHKDNIETNEPFGNESSSAGSSSTISVPPSEGNSSTESTSSEESTSSASETIETNSTPSKAESVSSTQTSSKPATTASKPAASKPSNVTSSKPTTSTPSNGGNTGTGSKWVCPDPAAHGSDDGTFCRSAQEHQENIAEYNRLMEEAKNQKPLVYPPGYDSMTWCTDCEKPFGDGHNGTCYLHWEGDTIVHGNYD